MPVLSHDPQREGRHARPRQYAAAGDFRPARPRRAHLRRDDGHAQTLRVLQGLPARMPDRRRHGQDEDRSPGRARRETWAVAARPAGGLPAALCRLGGALCPACQLAQQQSVAAKMVRKIRRHQRAAGAAHVAARRVPAGCRGDRPGRWPRGRAVRRHVQPHLERENLDAALRVLVAGGYRVHLPKPADGGRPLCCGRTFLSAGPGR